MLNQVTNKTDDRRLIITSHNFFAFYPDSRLNGREFIEKEIISRLQEKIENKKPLIIGFDLLPSNMRSNPVKSKTGQRRTKGATEGSDLNTSFNPYDRGIDAIVCYLKVEQNSYAYGTHIWECWQDKGECSKAGIEDQYEKRAFSLGGKRIGLLSCGDIARYCHDDGELLPKVDIYVDLSHRSLGGWTSQNKIPPMLIEDWGKCSYVLVTQQVQYACTSYLKSKKYPYIFPKDANHQVKELRMNGVRRGVVVDIDVP